MTMPNIADELVASMAQAVEIMEGRMKPGRVWTPPATVDVRQIRAKTGLTREAFANHYGFSRNAVRDWEQGVRRPEKAARTLLLVIDREPQAVERVLAQA
ncbi:helix-turn-helix domain-containing protein [Gluconacetobacter takamatsuzukensis]|uniref:Helix-turn-helix domain-containing protein n=1 Tax=Gluconacetobacter takamatsuzukensis TaxID=1286190 RepID=A0A7W4PPW9_9PROT|nr:helix-turn-helix domain-containing protein [Gluconacetobacter takamatsuzukensis]MBB2205900.1 helix-turn-helix domain-containing protein [Gluconacetobacter takamatsuzukensis]